MVMPNTNTLDLDILVTMTSLLFDTLNGNMPLKEVTRNSIAAEFEELLATLGIPGQPLVVLETDEHSILADDQLLQVTVNGEACSYSQHRVGRVYSYITGQMPKPEDNVEVIGRWLVDQVERWDGAQKSFAAEFLSMLCAADTRQQPACLFGSGQASAYIAMLSEEDDDFGALVDAGKLAQILREVLDVRIALVDRRIVAETIRKSFAAGLDADEIAENLITALYIDKVDILISQELPAELTATSDEGSRDHFLMMREALFFDLGLYLPEFQFVLTPELKSRTFAFRINHLTTLPWLSLGSGQYLADATVNNLDSLGITATPAINPVNGLESGLIDGSISGQEASFAEEKSINTWDPMGYLALCMSANLREQRHCLMHAVAAGSLLEQLAKYYPNLVKIVQARFNNQQLAAMLRHLLRNDRSLLDLRSILEQVLDFDTVNVDSPELVVVGDHLPVAQAPDRELPQGSGLLAAFVERGMEQQFIRASVDISGFPIQLMVRPAAEHSVDPLPMDERLAKVMSEYDREQVGEVIPLLLVMSAGSINFDDLDEETQQIFTDFLLKLDYDADWDSEQILAAIVNYYTENPLNPDLVNSLTLAFQSDIPLDEDAYVVKQPTKYALG